MADEDRESSERIWGLRKISDWGNDCTGYRFKEF